ncbi:hypothetical protein ACH41H_14905 [Streptomyces sp. NPDC020800]
MRSPSEQSEHSERYEAYEQTDWVHLTSYANLPGCPRPVCVLLG